MLKELFEAIGKQACAARGPQVVDDPRTPGGRLVFLEGAQVLAASVPRFELVKCRTLGALLSIGEQWRTGGETVRAWYVRDRVAVTTGSPIDAGHVATFELQTTTAARLLDGKPEFLAHAEFVRRLRLDLIELGLRQLAQDLRAVEWLAGQKTASESARGRDTFGKSIDAAVAQVDQLPEELTVTIRPWSDLPLAGPTVLQLEVDAAAQRFGLCWHPEARRAWWLSRLDELGELLAERMPWAASIVAGSPGVRELGTVDFEG